MHKYSCYKYKIQEIDVEIACYPGALEPTYKTGYEYIILDVYMFGGNEESSEWYDTEAEAHIAAQDKIDELESGDHEPDYDCTPFGEHSPEWWEERRRMGE